MRSRPVLIAPIRAAHVTRHPVTDHPRRGLRSDIQEDDVRLELAQRGDLARGLDRPAVRRERRSHRIGDRARPALGHRPAAHMPGRPQHHADRRRQRRVEASELVRRDAAEQRLSLLCRESTSQHRCRQRSAQPEHRHQQRMLGDANHGSKDVLGECGEVLGDRPDDLLPRLAVSAEPVCGLVDVLPQHARAAVVQRVRELDLRPQPPQPELLEPKCRERRRQHAGRVKGRAVVVQDAGHRELRGTRAAADAVRLLVDAYIVPLHREAHGGSEPIGPTADDRDLAHALLPAPASGSGVPLVMLQSTWCGIGPFGSQGCSATVCATLKRPRSITPTAGSISM